VNLTYTENNAFIGNNVSATQQAGGLTTYRILGFVNRGLAEVTNIKIWQDSSNPTGLSIGIDQTRDGSAPYQDISVYGETWPVQVKSWNSGTTSETGLAISSLAPAQDRGIAVRRVIAAGTTATPETTYIIYYQYDFGATTYYGTIAGTIRIADSDLVLYNVYHGLDSPVDFSAVYDTFTAFPYSASGLADGYHRFVIRQQNQYGLESQDQTEYTVRIDSTEEIEDPPSAPVDIGAEAAADGYVRVTATYLYPQDTTAQRADTWAIWAQAGSALDPDVDTATDTEAFSVVYGIASLSKLVGPFTDGATVYVSVRARRTGTPGVDSENTGSVTAVADATNPDDIDDLACQYGLITDALADPVAFWQSGSDASIERVPSTNLWRFKIGGNVVAAIDNFGQLHCETLNTLPFTSAQAMTSLIEYNAGEIWIGAGSPLQRVMKITGAGEVQVANFEQRFDYPVALTGITDYVEYNAAETATIFSSNLTSVIMALEEITIGGIANANLKIKGINIYDIVL
jgi:hypothetical protein